MKDSTVRRVYGGCIQVNTRVAWPSAFALLAQAHNPRRLVRSNDDSDVDSCACPDSALLDGIPGRIPGDRLFSPLCGLRVSHYRRGDAVTSTPEGQECNLHADPVVKDQMISAPYPLQPWWNWSFRETDRSFYIALGQ